MGSRDIRRRCEELIHHLDIPVPFSAHELCRRLANSRGRQIHLHTLAMPPGNPCGIWVRMPDSDYIFYERHTSGLHQEHIILHEVGHLLGSHRASTLLGSDLPQLLLPDLDPQMIGRVLSRTDYSEADELEAEVIASLILARASRWSPEPDQAGPAGRTGVPHRLWFSFENVTHRGHR